MSDQSQSPEAKSNADWDQLLSFLPPNFRELAVKYAQLEVKFGNAKITKAEQLLRLIFVHVGANLLLRQAVTLVAKAGVVEVSHKTLHQKMRHAGPYLQALVNELSASARLGTPELWSGYEVIAIDATADSSPGSTGTDARVHTAIRVADLTVLHAEVTGVSGGETLKRFPLKPGQLALVDRGYSNGPGIASAVKKGAEVLGRLNRGSLPVYERNDSDSAAIDVMERLRSLKGRRVCEWAVEVRTEIEGEPMVIPGRLVAVRLPEREAEDARQRVRSEYGSKTTEDMLEAAGYVALFTTVPAERISAAHCIELYRLRWQVELLFKRWKSICGLDQLPNEIEDTVLSWILGKIVLALLLDRMGSAGTELFPPERGAERKRRRSAHC